MPYGGAPAFVGLSRHGEVRKALLDFGVLIRDLASRPTHVSKLVQNPLDYVGYCDASGWDMGGLWFGGRQTLEATVWRVKWPADITTSIISDSNPSGTITNSDLEMAGVLMHESVLEEALGAEAMVTAQMAIGCNNSAAVAWTQRMATHSKSPTSFRLLKGPRHATTPDVVGTAGRLPHSGPPKRVGGRGIVTTEECGPVPPTRTVSVVDQPRHLSNNF
jgi:hypothetical protein